MAKTQSTDPEPMKRVSPGATIERELWAKAAGRCTLCATYLFKSSFLYKNIAVGQVAHKVGATDAPGSPRGDSDLSASERAQANNLMLLCSACHKMIDDDPARYPVDWLARQKDMFETRVREVTSFPSLAPTVVVEFTSPIRGNPVSIRPAEVSEALQFSDLQLAGEDVRDARVRIALTLPESAEGVWRAGVATINHEIEKAHRSFDYTQAESISVFGLGPIPLLVCLGAAIGNKVSVNVFESHREENRSRWRWPADANTPVDFELSSCGPNEAATEVVAFISVTARVQEERIPSALTDLPRLNIQTVSEPRAGVVSSIESLRNFSRVWREALQITEARFPKVRTLHLFCATPASVSIEVGRHRMRDASPSIFVYQLTSDKVYVPATLIE